MDEKDQSTQGPSENTTDSPQKNEPTEVGLSASAGGLVVLKAFFEAICRFVCTAPRPFMPHGTM